MASRKWGSPWTRGVVLASLAVALAGCKDDRTEIVVVVDTDLDVPGEISSIRVDVTDPDGQVKSALSEGITSASLPTSLGLVHNGGPLGPYTVRAVGLLGGAEVIDRTARVSFVEHRTLVLRLNLLRGCVGVNCGQDQTCSEHGCRSIDVPESELTEWTGLPPRITEPSDGGVDAGDADTPETGCGDFDFAVHPGEPPDLVLVVDRSLSMDDEIEAGTTKWEALLDAIETVTTSLESVVHFGLASYPGSGRDMCESGEVIIDPEPNNAGEIVDRLQRDGTNGATPTAMTLQAVGDYLAIARDGHENHPPAILLATDGAPNCNGDLDWSTCVCTVSGGGNCGGGDYCLDDERTYSAIENVAGGSPAIPIYVVGLPGTEEYTDVLSEMARRGGTARTGDPAYYAPTDSSALEDALTEIAEGLVTCVFETDIAPEDPTHVRVLLDDEEVPHVDDRSNGWDFTNSARTVIELFGSWCDRLTDGGNHVLTASYECMSVW